jgi:hypothetical protein
VIPDGMTGPGWRGEGAACQRAAWRAADAEVKASGRVRCYYEFYPPAGDAVWQRKAIPFRDVGAEGRRLRAGHSDAAYRRTWARLVASGKASEVRS